MTLTPAIAIRAGVPKDPDVHATHQHLSPSRRVVHKSPRWHKSSSPLSHHTDEGTAPSAVSQHLLPPAVHTNDATEMSMCVGGDVGGAESSRSPGTPGQSIQGLRRHAAGHKGPLKKILVANRGVRRVDMADRTR